MGKWIEWSGGECPVPRETLVDVKYRDGTKVKHLPALKGVRGEPRDASHPFWRNDGQSNDIVAWRYSWIKWEGGERPVPAGTEVQTKWSDGEKLIGVFDNPDVWSAEIGLSVAIVAYRLVLPK